MLSLDRWVRAIECLRYLPALVVVPGDERDLGHALVVLAAPAVDLRHAVIVRELLLDRVAASTVDVRGADAECVLKDGPLLLCLAREAIEAHCGRTLGEVSMVEGLRGGVGRDG